MLVFAAVSHRLRIATTGCFVSNARAGVSLGEISKVYITFDLHSLRTGHPDLLTVGDDKIRTRSGLESMPSGRWQHQATAKLTQPVSTQSTLRLMRLTT